MQTNVEHSYYINICTVGSLGQLVTETFYGVPVGKQGWEHFVWHLTTNDLAALNEDYADDIILYFGVREGTGYRTIKNLKLEKGSTDTEWCKSPEDCIKGTALTEITAAAFDVMEQFLLDNPHNSEEWITIANHTKLTEDVASLEFTTDQYGNPFNCKEIVAMVVMNATGVIGTRYYLGVDANSVYAHVRDQYGFVVRSTANGIFHRHETHDYSGWVHHTNYGCNTKRDTRMFDKYCISMPVDVPLKAGTQYWVWGLRA
jgi:hypothetical protein